MLFQVAMELATNVHDVQSWLGLHHRSKVVQYSLEINKNHRPLISLSYLLKDEVNLSCMDFLRSSGPSLGYLWITRQTTYSSIIIITLANLITFCVSSSIYHEQPNIFPSSLAQFFFILLRSSTYVRTCFFPLISFLSNSILHSPSLSRSLCFVPLYIQYIY